MQPCRQTAKAPQALAYLSAVGQSSSSSQPFSKPAHEAVAGAEHVEHLDGKARPALAVVEIVGNGAGKGHRPRRAALADQRGVRDFAHRPQRRDRVGGAAGDVELLLGADDQVEQVQGRLQLLRHPLAFDEAVLAFAEAGQPPEIGPVVDVERRARAVLARQPQRLERRRLGVADG